MKKTLSLLALSPALFLIGCGSGTPKPAATADAAVMQAVDSLEENDPSGIWHMLPASYQTQANGVLHDFAEKMPSDVYEQGAELAKKLENVLKSKKSLLLESPMLASAPIDVSANYDQAVAIIGAVTSSDLMSVESLKKADIGVLLGSIGRKLMETADKMELDQNQAPFQMSQAMGAKDKLGTMNAELVSEDGDIATVRLSMEGEPPQELEFVKIEGKWIPGDVADNWGQMIAQAKAGVADMEIPPQVAAQIKMGMTMADSVLEQLLKAETQEDLEQVFTGLMGMGMGM